MTKQILGIDIGSSKTRVIVGEINDGVPKIAGLVAVKSLGIKRGTITNIDQAAKAIKTALQQVEAVSGISISKIKKAVVSLSTAYTKSSNSSAIVNVPSNEIGIREIQRAIQTALYNAYITDDYQVIHAIPYNFKVDGVDGIEDPAGMSGGRLEVDVHIITAQKTGLGNLKKTIQLAGLEIDNIVLSSYASGLAVLKEDELDLGVALIDIGATTSDTAIFINKAIRYTDFLGVGSHHITNDLSMALHTPISEAEYIKQNHGSLLKNLNSTETIEISVIGDEDKKNPVSLELISNIMFARIEETLMLLSNSITKNELKNRLGAGVVLTGGFTKLEGLRELAIPIFDNMPVRIAKPNKIDGMFDEKTEDPGNATAIGLLLYDIKHIEYEIDSNNQLRSKYNTPVGNNNGISINQNPQPAPAQTMGANTTYNNPQGMNYPNQQPQMTQQPQNIQQPQMGINQPQQPQQQPQQTEKDILLGTMGGSMGPINNVPKESIGQKITKFLNWAKKLF